MTHDDHRLGKRIEERKERIGEVPGAKRKRRQWRRTKSGEINRNCRQMFELGARKHSVEVCMRSSPAMERKHVNVTMALLGTKDVPR